MRAKGRYLFGFGGGSVEGEDGSSSAVCEESGEGYIQCVRLQWEARMATRLAWLQARWALMKMSRSAIARSRGKCGRSDCHARGFVSRTMTSSAGGCVSTCRSCSKPVPAMLSMFCSFGYSSGSQEKTSQSPVMPDPVWMTIRLGIEHC